MTNIDVAERRKAMGIIERLRSARDNFGLIRKIVYSIISFVKMLTPLFSLEGEVSKFVGYIEPIFMGAFDFFAEHMNIFLFVGFVTLLTGIFTYIVFPVGEAACLLAAATGYLLAPRIQEGFLEAVSSGRAVWDVAAACAPYVFWICLPTLFVGAVCVCRKLNKKAGLIKNLLISGLATLVIGLLLGLYAFVAYGLSIGANPASTVMFIAILLVTVAEQFFIFAKRVSD